MAIKKTKIEETADELGTTPEILKASLQPDWDGDGSNGPVEIDIDFEAGGAQDYPDGTYHARLEAIEKKIASTGNSMVVWRFRTLKDKRAFWTNTVLTKDAMWKVTETAVACGAKGDGQTKIDVAKLVGNLCRLVIKNETYEGSLRPAIKKVLPPNQETFDLSDLG